MVLPADTPSFYATDLPRLPSGSSVPVPWATADAADLAAIDAAFGGTPQKVIPGRTYASVNCSRSRGQPLPTIEVAVRASAASLVGRWSDSNFRSRPVNVLVLPAASPCTYSRGRDSTCYVLAESYVRHAHEKCYQ